MRCRIFLGPGLLMLVATAAVAQTVTTTAPRDVVVPAQPPVRIDSPPRDPGATPRVGTGVIQGRVIDGASGKAIARARVSLEGNQPRSPVLTNERGEFTFSKLPSGGYRLRVAKSTYLMATLPDSS